RLQTNVIDGSFNGFQGIAQVNQTTGGGNVQLNVAAIAFAAGAHFDGVVLTDVELALVTGPESEDGGPNRVADGSYGEINNSFQNFTGIAQAQQVMGDHNIVTNVVAVAIAGGS